jgi:hypothetical protein
MDSPYEVMDSEQRDIMHASLKKAMADAMAGHNVDVDGVLDDMITDYLRRGKGSVTLDDGTRIKWSETNGIRADLPGRAGAEVRLRFDDETGSFTMDNGRSLVDLANDPGVPASLRRKLIAAGTDESKITEVISDYQNAMGDVDLSNVKQMRALFGQATPKNLATFIKEAGGIKSGDVVDAIRAAAKLGAKGEAVGKRAGVFGKEGKRLGKMLEEAIAAGYVPKGISLKSFARSIMDDLAGNRVFKAADQVEIDQARTWRLDKHLEAARFDTRASAKSLAFDMESFKKSRYFDQASLERAADDAKAADTAMGGVDDVVDDEALLASIRTTSDALADELSGELKKATQEVAIRESAFSKLTQCFLGNR